MPQQTAGTLQAETERLLRLLDAMELDALNAMLTEDAQSVDELTRGWTRGQQAIETYLQQLANTVSDVRSQTRDLHTIDWSDTGIVTFVLEQSYLLNGTRQLLTAPTTIVFRRLNNEWKVALIHTVPLPDERAG
jgi:ketosteroid isomerase-like protein